MFCVTPLGGFFEFAPSFLWTSFRVSFSFADFALYPVTIVNCRHWTNYMLSFENESCKFSWQITEPKDRRGDTNTLKKKKSNMKFIMIP